MIEGLLGQAKLIGGGIGAVVVTLGTIYIQGKLDEADFYRTEFNRERDAHNITRASLTDAMSALSDWEDTRDEYAAQLEKLGQLQVTAQAELERMNDVFQRHDFQRLLDAKPGLIERRVNAGTRSAYRLLECATRANRSDCGNDTAPVPSTDTPTDADTLDAPDVDGD